MLDCEDAATNGLFRPQKALWRRILQGVAPSPTNFAEPASHSVRRLGVMGGGGGVSTFISDLCFIRSRKRMRVKWLPRQTNSFRSLIDIKGSVTTSRAAFSSPGSHSTSNHCLHSPPPFPPPFRFPRSPKPAITTREGRVSYWVVKHQQALSQ